MVFTQRTWYRSLWQHLGKLWLLSAFEAISHWSYHLIIQCATKKSSKKLADNNLIFIFSNVSYTETILLYILLYQLKIKITTNLSTLFYKMKLGWSMFPSITDCSYWPTKVKESFFVLTVLIDTVRHCRER